MKSYSCRWISWRKTAKAQRLRYWLAEEGLDYLQSFIYWPYNRIRDVRIYIKNRWVNKTHALTSNLKRGSWYDFDVVLINAIFDELVNFVEIELAWMHVISAENKYKTLKFKQWRSPEAGLAYLAWAKELRYGTDDGMSKDNPLYGQLTHQANAAIETEVLYCWWKNEYPNRPDPMDASGWSKYCEDRRAGGIDIFDFRSTNDEERDKSRKISEKCRQIEEQQNEEDTSMLTRLIKLRHHLWT